MRGQLVVRLACIVAGIGAGCGDNSDVCGAVTQKPADGWTALIVQPMTAPATSQGYDVLVAPN
jgi:hypothetical protein